MFLKNKNYRKVLYYLPFVLFILFFVNCVANIFSVYEKILISEIFNYAQKKMNIIDNSFFEKTEYKNCMIQVESIRFIISSIEGGTDFLSHVITLTYNTNYNEKKPLSEENPKFIKNPTHEWYEQKFEKFL